MRAQHEGRDAAWQPLVEYRRAGIAEVTVHGAISWVSGRELVHAFGGNVLVYGRSMMKPLQMKVLARELDGVLSGEQKAIALASHNADPEHVRAVKSMLSEAE